MDGGLSKKEEITLHTIEKEELQNISAYLQKLYSIWGNFGMNDGQKLQRGRVVWKHVRNLFQDVVDEELSFYKDIQDRIQNYTIKIEALSRDLSMAPKIYDNCSLIKKEESMRRELDTLTKLKHKRLKTYKELKSVESVYCSVLGEKEYKLSSFTGVPSEKDLIEIDRHIHALTKERDKRHKKFCLVKKELTTILEATELTPETSFEKEILSSDSDTVSLTDEAFKTLENVISKVQSKKSEMIARRKLLLDKLLIIWDQIRVPESKRTEFLSKHVGCKLSTLSSIQDELNICEEVKEENIRLNIERLRKELQRLWDQCYASEIERKSFVLFQSIDMTDEVLEAHEKEVKKWKDYYEEVKHILIKIEERKKLWDLLLSFENKASDPNRFKNRGCNLLQEEKERKKLQKDLPTLENEIFCEIDTYEATHDKFLQYYGEDYRNFVTLQWKERIDKKETEKKQRHRRRILQTENEMLGTPIKKPLFRTPKSTPGKLFKPKNLCVNGATIYYTPVANFSKFSPNTVQCSRPTPQKSGINYKLFSSNSRRKIMKKKIQSPKDNSESASSSFNSTTYSEFADELDSKHSFQSSVLSDKILDEPKTPSSSKNKRKSPKKLPKSMRNVLKTTPNATPTRGKLGLPFLI